MKLILTLIMATSFAFAGKIVPNIMWNKTVQNESGAAAALSNRNNVTLEHYRDEENEETQNLTNISKTSSNTLKGNINKAGISAEITLDRYKDNDQPSSDDESDTIRLNVGKKLNNKFTLGLNGLHSQEEDKSAYSETGISGNYLLNENIIIGAGISNIHFNGNDFNDFKKYYVGVGYMNDNMAFETTLDYRPSKEDGGFKTSDLYDVRAQGTITLDRVQLSPVLIISKDNNEQTDDKSSSIAVFALAEYMINKNFYVGGLLSFSDYSYEDGTDSNDDLDLSSKSVGATVRYVINKFQVAGGYNFSDLKEEENTGNTETKSDSFNISGTYFF